MESKRVDDEKKRLELQQQLRVNEEMNDDLEESNNQLDIYKNQLEEKVKEQTYNLRLSKDRYQKLLELSSEGIFVMDPKTGQLLEYSYMVQKLLGYSSDELKNLSVFDWDKNIKTLEDYNFIIKHISYNKPFQFETTHTKKDGSIYIASISAIKLKIDKKDYIYSSVRDITLSKEKDLLLAEQSKLAAIGDMLGNIAHQWRQPLSTISVLAGTLGMKAEMGLLSVEDAHKFEEDILSQTQYLSDTIDTFRDFIKGDNTKEDISVCEVIDEGLSIVKDSLKNNHISVNDQVHCEEDCGRKVHISQHEFAQVIINILNNAKDVLVQRKVEDPWIKINHNFEKDIAIITIEDNGGGIPEDILPKIFEPYFTTKHKSTGTGLGLHMAYKIITESMNGKLYAKNTNNGAKFYIELPLNN